MAMEDTAEGKKSVVGYEEELHRGLGLFGTLSTSFAQQGVMASTALLFSYGLSNGGPAVLLYVWIIGSVLSCIVGICLAEICSKYPYAGSVYNWAGELTTKEKAPITKYSTGWLNFLGNAFSSVGYSFGFGQFVASLYDLRQVAIFQGDDDHRPAPLSLGMQVLIAMIGTTAMALVNILRIDTQAWMNIVNFVFSVGSLLAICIALMTSDSKKQTLYWAFTTTYNSSGFDDFGYVILTATLTLLFGVAGYEASAHLAEETVNPRVVAPWVSQCILSCPISSPFNDVIIFSEPSFNFFSAGHGVQHFHHLRCWLHLPTYLIAEHVGRHRQHYQH